MATISETLELALKEQLAGRPEDTRRICGQILQIDPSHAAARNLAGIAAFQLGEHDVAADHFRRAIVTDPYNPKFYRNLGNVHRDLRELDEAVSCYRRALQINPDSAPEQVNLARTLVDQGKLDEAAEHHRQALRVDPEYGNAHNGLGNVFRQKGDFQQAKGHYNRAIELNPDLGVTYRSLVEMKRYTSPDCQEVRQVEAILARDDVPQRTREYLNFAMGKVYDDCGQWDRAFGHFRAANELADATFDEQECADQADNMIRIFGEPLLRETTRVGLDDDLLVFIVGMPRSGTTLVEQIISSHPQVFGSGERDEAFEFAEQLLELMNPPGESGTRKVTIDCQSIVDIAQEFVGLYRRMSGNAIRVTDKTPINFIILGAIAILLPKVRIIHCRRNPLDTCLSCYFRNFGTRPPYSYDLHNLGAFYRHYAKLMNHWRAVLPLQMMEIDYEDLVENQEHVSRKMIDFCGLEWHPDCLDFHKNGRIVRTASNWQVRQPMYHHAVARWKHYEKHLGPLKEALGWKDEPMDRIA